MRVNWSDKEIAQLRQLWLEGVAVEKIAAKLKRTEGAVKRKTLRINLELETMPVPAPRPAVEVPELNQCAWLESDKRPWPRCKNKTWNGTAWCKEHWAVTHIVRRRSEEVA